MIGGQSSRRHGVLLSDRSIRAELQGGGIVIEPLADDAIQPSSVDLRLDATFRIFHNHSVPLLDVRTDQSSITESIELADGRPLTLQPGELILGSTLERVAISDRLVGRLEGKSSLGRLGLLIHSTAGFIDPGWSGHLTLNLYNAAKLPILLYPGMKVCQVSFLEMTTAAEAPYGSQRARSKYQGQRGPGPSRYYEDYLGRDA
jgi:dCTP deaminase